MRTMDENKGIKSILQGGGVGKSKHLKAMTVCSCLNVIGRCVRS